MKRLKLTRLLVVNDFAALAHALPAFESKDLLAVGGGHGVPKTNLLVCGPGTGFGVAALLYDGKQARAFASEAGHMRLGAATAEEARVIAHLVRELGSLVVEHILSGPGLARLHQVLAGEHLTPEAIIAAAHAGAPAVRATAEVFLRLYGRIAGDLALAFNARGGIYLAGGVARALAPLIPASPFRAAFEDHPPYQARLAAIPVRAVLHARGGLVGALALARSLVKKS